MADFANFKAIRRETVQTIRARMDRDVNAGVDPNDTRFIDTVEGGFYWDNTQPSVLEIERLWDMATTESPAVAFPAWAYGEYLDEHGITLDIPRKPAAKASGFVTFTGAVDTPIGSGVRVAVPAASPDADPIIFVTTESGTVTSAGTAIVAIEAEEAGEIGNVQSGQITFISSPLAGITAVTNADSTASGADVEADAPYRERLLLDFASAQGAGTVTDYVRWALSVPGVGHVTVEPLFAGNGTVRVIITDINNRPVAVALLNTVQQYLDPTPAQGAGQAPIGAAVTVATPVKVDVTVTSNMAFFPGYSLDGTGGTIPTRGEIEEALSGYLDALNPGVDVVLKHVEAQFFRIAGVQDVSGTLINGVAANLVIAPMEVASMARDVDGNLLANLT